MKYASRFAAKYGALVALALLFIWVYARAIPDLYFAMDDFFNTAREIYTPISNVLLGDISWSGYRPFTIIMRILMVRVFGLEYIFGYYVVILGLHFANTVLAYLLVRRVTRREQWSFVVAAVVLLLPSHNEAVFWFGANAGPLSLLFTLIALHCAWSYRLHAKLWTAGATLLFYAFAVLSYEVVIVLPLLLFAAEWGLDGRIPARRKQWQLYVSMMAMAAVLLLMRFATSRGALLTVRPDYAFSLNFRDLLDGYLMLAGQMILLHTSPWLGTEPFANVRDWMPLTAVDAIVAIVLAAVCVVFVFSLPKQHRTRQVEHIEQVEHVKSPEAKPAWRVFAFWFAWGLLWVLSIGLPFAGLAERNPENRYTYLLSFGMGVMVAALFAWLWHWARAYRAARVPVLAALVALVALYAYVSTSDASEWSRAGTHARQVGAGIDDYVQGELAQGSTIFATGIPNKVGAAYVFELEGAFQASVDLAYGYRPQRAILGDTSLRARLLDEPDAPDKPDLYAFLYAADSGKVHHMKRVLLCDYAESCIEPRMAQTTGNPEIEPLVYVQMFDAQMPDRGSTIWLGYANREAELGCFFIDVPDNNDQRAEQCALAQSLAYQ